MTDQPFPSPALRERVDGFDYNLWMNCACGEVSSLSQGTYVEGAHDSRMRCSACSASIHYGPAVAAVRNVNDPALRSADLNSYAWYHTSTDAEWPSSRRSGEFARDVAQSSKALHVGTYEAAIENMLRRMDDQADAESQFYLYRVALRVETSRVNPGYRDENQEIASDISIRELDDEGLSAVRYLNVHEAIGSISLAIRPESIRAIQGTPIPLPNLPVDIGPDVIRTVVDATHRAVRELAEAAAAFDVRPHVRRAMVLGIRPDPTGIAKRYKALERTYYRRWRELDDLLADACLPHVSALVRQKFNDAVGHLHSDDPNAYAAQYRAYATLLERPEAVLAELTRSRWRAVTP